MSNVAKDSVAQLHGEFDAMKWARVFCELYPQMDEGLMVAWFANAIMAGFDRACKYTQLSREELCRVIGEASMCWTPPPSGVFDSMKACRIANRYYGGHEELTSCKLEVKS